MDPFPGNIGQIVQAKINDEKPEFPLQFPEALKNVIRDGWSQKPRERPDIEKFRSALNLQKQEEDSTHNGKFLMIFWDKVLRLKLLKPTHMKY